MKSVRSQPDVTSSVATASQNDCPALPGALSQVSVIIPIGPGDLTWKSLTADLAQVDEGWEWIFVATVEKPPEFDLLMAEIRPRGKIRWIISHPGRAHQMNLGVELSDRSFLWFLHADSRVSCDAVAALERSLDSHPQAIHFFDLDFQSDGPRLAQWNARGVRFRSRCLGLPFGDQGLCLSRELFCQLGRFNEQAAYGEDHLLIWAARRARVAILPVGASIATSARKYASHGWLATTALHAWRTWRQALPELVKLLRARWR